MKRLCVLFALVILLLPVVSFTDDAIALQDNWLNGDPLDDGISKAPQGPKHCGDDCHVVAAFLRALDSIHIADVCTLAFVVRVGAATDRYALRSSQTSAARIPGRSPPLS